MDWGMLATLFATSVALAMDAFSVAVCKGLALQKIKFKHTLIVGAWFGVFQALMPFIGYLLGSTFENYVSSFSPWISFGLLAFLGINMIREAFGDEESVDCSLSVASMLMLAIATSIDALAAGVEFAMSRTNIFIAITFIGVVTFILSAIGVKIGSIFGTKYNKAAEITGGVVLIILGLRILLVGLGVL